MTKGTFAGAAIIVFFFATVARGIEGFFAAALIVGVPYLISVWVHPRTRHTGWRGCNGTGEHRGSVFKWSHRRCPGCDGGRLVRAGAGYFGSERMRNEYHTRKEARKNAKKERRWR
jgi:hypothetical protein